MNKIGFTIPNSLNVRSGPSRQYTVVDRLKFNTQITIIDEAQEESGYTWYSIGSSRWVEAGFVKLS